MSTRVAAVDCGTNSVRLLIADVAGDSLRDLERLMEIVRLGEDVDRTGRLAPRALRRTFAAMRRYRELIDHHAAEETRVVATSATRDAANRQEFAEGVREIFGVDPEVVTGDEEAALSFTGATRGLARLSPEAGARPPYLVLDIGGGSTEFVVGDDRVEGAISVDVGSVRLTERYIRNDPPTAAELESVVADIEAALDRVTESVPVQKARTLVGLAGSVTTLAGMALDLPTYDSDKIHHSRISAGEVHEVTRRLLSMTHGDRLAVPVMHPGRADVIGAGALILDRVLRRFAFSQVIVSEHDILDGIAWSVAR
ncbi:exopolyphosphatase [Nonomuraea sp. NPDC059023]|uniref:Ppx/GppA phosphatase family protein n=1 Tax=unclassified Nonomuraea TaxID=2593643 RepID=UPI0036C213AE